MSGMGRTLLASLLLLAAVPARAEQGDRVFMAQLVGRTFFRGLLAGNVESLLPLCAEQVSLDGEVVKGREALLPRLKAMATRARELGIQLRRVEVLSYQEVVRRFGPPPERLRRSVGPGQLVVLARFSSLGAVAVLRRVGPFWKITAISD